MMMIRIRLVLNMCSDRNRRWTYLTVVWSSGLSWLVSRLRVSSDRSSVFVLFFICNKWCGELRSCPGRSSIPKRGRDFLCLSPCATSCLARRVSCPLFTECPFHCGNVAVTWSLSRPSNAEALNLHSPVQLCGVVLKEGHVRVLLGNRCIWAVRFPPEFIWFPH
jgi:hypothetical protein